ncbi:pyridoxamine 5'-phosphate oxidase family protein [Paludibacter sp. 221]|uniref:pyridoxamine 5'-phosphate oxidase family protein n=1 Tax=Paludibacter sp. 221 TaxID=2302939 RepID=UPI0013D6D3B8|nr:pyridoxamine 5'-phosphate oxidase family protein [Paludibacter sp. 221]NDV45776.1 pyridoxamine 5'-phosphate oxidase family protein [Paludibacter sp. 221]
MNDFPPIRRQDRLLNTDRINELLETGEYGFFSLGANANGYAYGIPVNYVYDRISESLYVHCAPEGEKMNILQKSNRLVSFCIVGKTCPVPQKFTTLYESVIVFGEAEIVLADDEKRKGIRKLVEKYCPGYIEVGEKYMESSFARTSVIKIKIQHMTGKSKA